MNLRALWIAMAVALGILGSASVAEACSCGGPQPGVPAFTPSPIVFIGTVERLTRPFQQVIELPPTKNPDGSFNLPGAAVLGSYAAEATFRITRWFRGGSAANVVIRGGGSNCDEPFKLGEAWLVYAFERDGVVSTSKCTRTRLLGQAGEDVKYLDGIALGRSQSVLHGKVLRRVTVEGQLALRVPLEQLDIVAQGRGQRVAVKAEQSGSYYLIVLPPGEFEVWGERGGQAITPRTTVELSGNEERWLAFQYD